MQMMKAAVFHDIENIVMEQRPIPGCPKDGLLVKVHYCGICGGDVRNYHNGLKGGIKNQIMGHEISGEIVVADSSVTNFRVGDRVAMAPDISCGHCWYCRHGMVNLCQSHRMLGTHLPGGYAQYVALPKDVLEHGFVEKIPDGMSYQHAAFAETCAAVVACQRKNNISLGDTVIIIGDGPVGCLHYEVAKARGAAKVIIAGRDKLELAKQFQPEYLIDNSNMEEATEKMLAITGGLGADVVILALPSTVPQLQALKLVRKGGKVIIYGGVPKPSELSPLNSNLIHYNELNVVGAFSYPATGLHDALDALEQGVIHADRYITSVIPLEQVAEGMEQMRQGKAMKVLLDPWAES